MVVGSCAPELEELYQGYLKRFVDVQSHLSKKAMLILDQEEEFLNQVKRTWLGSDFVANQCILNPQLIHYIFDIYRRQKDLNKKYIFLDHKEELHEFCEEVYDKTDLMHKLRCYRNQQMVRIIWQDLNRMTHTEETLRDLSNLADSIITYALSWLYNEQTQSMGTPVICINEEGTVIRQELVVLALGKLGGNELNLSSDIDLMFVYSEDGETVGHNRVVTHQEFFTKLGQSLIKVIDFQTKDGFVFRVDMRLRPYGKSGPLAINFFAMEQYYHDQGRIWERYAMVKARLITGNKYQKEKILHLIKSFVYRKYIDYSMIQVLKDMKDKIFREEQRLGKKYNIKKGPGGIREVEFVVQIFQLMYGGRKKNLQKNGFLETLDDLKKECFLSVEKANDIKDAYCFLRNLENTLQAIYDQQTQELPKDRIMRLRIAHSMYYKSWYFLEKDLNKYRHIISECFLYVFSGKTDSGDYTINLDEWKQMWLKEMTEYEEIEVIRSNGFLHINESISRVRQFRESKLVDRVSGISRKRLDDFMPRLLNGISKVSAPDICLERVLPIVKSILQNSAYLVLFIEKPVSLEYFCKLCVASIWVSEKIGSYPVLLDEFFHLDKIYTVLNKKDLSLELSRQIKSIRIKETKSMMNVLRYFKMSHILRLCVYHSVGALPLMKESDYLTWVAEVLLNHILSISWRSLINDMGFCQEKYKYMNGFMIAAYGKFGGIELGPNSDLDLVFFYKTGHNYLKKDRENFDEQHFYTRLAQKVIDFLKMRTDFGVLYEVDIRLRPASSSGTLVNSMHQFEKYQMEHAWTWEHQSLVKSRFVAGDSAMEEKFSNVREKVLSMRRNNVTLRYEIVSMREKIQRSLLPKNKDKNLFHVKYSSGGLVDIEFLVQYAVLAHCCRYPEISKYTDNIRISEILEEYEVITPQQGQLIRMAYQNFRMKMHQKAFQGEDNWVLTDEVKYYSTKISQLWNDWFMEK